MGWGLGGGVVLAYVLNSYVSLPLMDRWGLQRIYLYLLFAPVVEEALKALPLLYAVRQPSFTYFVDGAIYGFAAGIGFSITENILFIQRHPALALSIALARAFSTSLMHGSTTALVGVAVGRFRLRQYVHPHWFILGAVGVAVLLHAFFNGAVMSLQQNASLAVVLATGIGVFGFGVTLFTISLGLQEERLWLAESLDQRMVDLVYADLDEGERSWLTETLDREGGISTAELRAAQAYEALDTALEPLARQFPHRAEEMSRIVLQQAQIGIKRNLLEEIERPQVRDRLQEEIRRLEEDTKQRRQEVGQCAMLYLQCVFNPEDERVGPCMEAIVSCAQESGDTPFPPEPEITL
jgi:RsiW-degrading membrane proteinase PrsW (M82 family)